MKSLLKRYPAFAYPDFVRMWIGQLTSQAGNTMQLVTMNWQLYLITHSAIALGFIGFMRFIPIVIFSLLGGSFADSFNRKAVQMVCQSLRGVIAVILAFTTITGAITPLHIYILTFFDSGLVAFDSPSRQAIIPSLVPKEIFTSAMSVWIAAFQAATIVGPLIAGILIGRNGIPLIYVLNVFTFVIFIALLFSLKNSGVAHLDENENEISIAHIKEGLMFIKSNTIIWTTTFMDFLATFFSSAEALLPIFANDILKVGPQGLGFLYAAPALGSILAGLTVGRMGELKQQGKVLLCCVFFYGLGTVLFGLSKNYYLSLLALLIVGSSDSVSAIIRNVARQMSTPDSMRGRMSSITMIFFMGGPQLGEFEAGLVAGFGGAPFSVITGGIATMAVIVIMAAKIPALRNYSRKVKDPLI